MKKSEIKRRKRVVPALSDQHLVHQYAQSSNEASVSPDPASGAPYPSADPVPYPQAQLHTLEHVANERDPEAESRRQRLPVAVDFTHFATNVGRSSDVATSTQLRPASARKRSFSSVSIKDGDVDDRASGGTGSEPDNIDPSLSNMLAPIQNLNAAANSTEQTREQTTDQRRAELQREAARIRAMLEAKEREIAALGQ